MNVTVIDSIMGSGKTTWMMDHIKQQHFNVIGSSFGTGSLTAPRYLYITPTLDEVDRVTAECAALDFRNPEPVDGKKYYHLEKLIQEGRNICTTHSLFSNLNLATYAALRAQGYTLVIDEVLNCVELFDKVSKKDREHLFANQMVMVDEGNNKLRWNEDKFHDYTGRFDDIRDLCRNGNLVWFRNALLIWEFPSDFLKVFDQVYILTYLFLGSAMASYLSADGIDYTMMAVQDGKLVPWIEVDEKPIKERLRSLITIYEGKMNKVGEGDGKANPFSSSWFDRVDPMTLNRIKTSMETFFNKVAGSKSIDNAWTTFKKARAALTGKGYAKGFLPNNLRATNDHIEKKSLGYLCNIFYNPQIRGYFTDRGVMVFEDLYALGEMLQWLWRGQIRRYDPIQVFIPSERMRKLLKAWLSSDTIEDLFRKVGDGLPPGLSCPV